MKQRVLLAGINNPPNQRPLNTGVASRKKWEDLWLHLKATGCGCGGDEKLQEGGQVEET
jgi:hypothetical protein